MALTENALTSLEAVKAYLSLESTSSDALIEGLIEAVSAHFNLYTGRNLTARDYSYDPEDPAYDPDNAVINGSGHRDLLLPQYPVISLSALYIDGVELAQAVGVGPGWRLDRAAGLVSNLGGVFPGGQGNISLSYRAGFDPAPPDLAQAALEQTAIRFQESSAGHGRLGVSARTLADGSVSYAAKALLPQVSQVLDRYRSRSLL